MVVASFDCTYLTSTSNQLISKWSSEVEAESGSSAAIFDDTSMIFLPPMKPETLKIIFDLVSVEGPGSCDTEELACQLKVCLQNGLKFWDQLFYELQFSSIGGTIQLDLTCQVWNSEKACTLLQKPLENRPHVRNLPHVCVLKELRIDVDMCFSCEPYLLIDEILLQLNEYLCSLFISQLEFRFPLVFSATARKRFMSQESALGPISYALTNSSALLPILTKLISDDTTATTVYQVMKYRKRHTNHISFQIAKRQYDG
ncbi:hypothetical protein HG536_0C03960 [Torulaspora globosa]|uniref:Uncharacterized protein n=1 Tax=Torulaspora globosa TaxID=48254 RepID=A0A7G3ZFE1_9SACH|nr:uncharacterized protein HG536_0C03960 [Torulaspora globosa]QLL32227.1 hypothetical protein HG536_0C03960 [Torulaspora globosa]